MLVDSGASTNIIDQEVWESLKSKKIKCVSRKCNKQLFAYGSETPMKTLGSFNTTVAVGDRCTQSEFIVIDGKGHPLLGRNTATELGILQIGVQSKFVNSVKVDKEKICERYSECFNGIGKLTNYQLKLNIDPTVQPIAQQQYRLPFSLREKVSSKLKDLEEKDIIEKVEGPTPWISPVICVPKPDGDIRLCVGMRRANAAIVRERHPIPTVEEVLQEMDNSKIFSKLDLRWGYHQIELEKSSRAITTFVTHEGLYRYKRLMFGISSAPEKYQQIVQQVVQDIPGVRNISDDIIVHGSTQEEHDRRLIQVLDRIKERGLTLNKQKCKFNMTELEFMGHVLTPHGIQPADQKIKAVLNARQPENPTEVRSFLGLVQFNSRYIQNMATVSEPLRQLTRKGVTFKWGPSQEKAFTELKKRLVDSETLGYFQRDAKTKIICDASPIGLGAVLVQTQKGVDRVISYARVSLTETEKRYSQTEKEALAIVWACEKFHLYLYGIEFELITDHKPLTFIYSEKSKPSARIQRWVLRLQPYMFKVVYKPGKENVADSLSRLVKRTEETALRKDVGDMFVKFVATQDVPSAITMKEIEKMSADDLELGELRDCIENDQWKNNIISVQYQAVKNELCVIGKVVLRGSRVIPPVDLRPKLIVLAHEGHLGIVLTKQRLRSTLWWPGMDKDVERFVRSCHGCQLVAKPSNPEPLQPTKLPDGPWQDVAIDLLGPLPSGESILVVVDYYSRYFELGILKSTTSSC